MTAAPAASSAAVRARMRSQATRDTAPETAFRRALHALGVRFRVGRALPAVPGLGRCRPDVVLGPSRVAVFVDGCFWHGCPAHSRPVRANGSWWAAKLAANAARDARATAALRAVGWEVVRVWEHDDPLAAARAVADLVRARLAAAA